jgi:hypothetical protein
MTHYQPTDQQGFPPDTRALVPVRVVVVVVVLVHPKPAGHLDRCL